TLVDNSYNPSQPDPSGEVITNGTVSGALSDALSVSLSENGKVDATGVTSGLNNSYVHGTGGILVTSSTQTFTMSGSDTLGFSIVGDGSTAGANLQVGHAGGSIMDATIHLKGAQYDSEKIDVQSGLLEIGESSILGTATSTLTVGAAGTSGATGTQIIASVNNKGTINNDVTLNSHASLDNRKMIKGDVTVAGNAIMSNNGTIQGTVTVADNGTVNGSGTFANTIINSNASLYVGNSPGFQQHENLTLNGGSHLGFYLDGMTPATLGNHGAGTYSNILVNKTLTLNGTIDVNVEVGMGILAAGTDPFT
ncbi:MAG: hypothetical protein RR808_09065, partial [Akkermansia sp.]